MDVKIWPWKPTDKGVVCMPLRKNIPNPHDDGKHEDWKLVDCPECGAECWESDLARQVKQLGNPGLCTECALKKGVGKR